MSGFDELTYSDGRRNRHRVTIVLLVLAAWIACILGTTLTDWPRRNALALMAAAVVFGACLWWMFGSRKAGHVQVDAQSKDWFKRIGFGR